MLPDATVLGDLVHSAVDSRDTPSFADVAFVLGHDRARHFLRADLAKHPELDAKLLRGRQTIASRVAPGLFGAWLEAVRRLGDAPEGSPPSFQRTTAFADARMASAIAAHGQLRHGAVLIAGQPYSEGGCQIPDGWVDPVPHVYAALGEFARRGAALARVAGSDAALAYYTRVERVLSVLERIARNELAGRALSDAEKRFLAMVVEIQPPNSESPGSYDGWYFDLFPTIDAAFEEERFVADWFTGSNQGEVVHAGVTAPRLGLFVVDRGGAPRVFVGPVARPFELRTRLPERLTDEASLAGRALVEPWAASHVAPAPPAPRITVLGLGTASAPARGSAETGERAVHRFAVSSAAPVVIELLDHHRHVVGKVAAGGTPEFRRADATLSGDVMIERVRVRAGVWSWETASEMLGGPPRLSNPPQSDEALWALRDTLMQRFAP